MKRKEGKELLGEKMGSYARDLSEYNNPIYTNWNAGFTKDGKRKTYDYNFNRKATVAHADVKS